MDRLTIHALTLQSARGMLGALSDFHVELLETASGCKVVVTLGWDGKEDGEIVAVLNALEEYVSERAGSPARMELNGHSYVMHPEPVDW